jgi:hypothetical protein
MISNIWISRVAALLFILSILFLNWLPDRTDFIAILCAYTGAFVSYILLIKSECFGFKQLLVIAVLAQVISIVFYPTLSNDIYRFLWDGEMIWNGINPFDYKPNEIINQTHFRSHAYLNELYSGMSTLSRNHYTCYPTVNQFYFIIASAFSSSVMVNTIVLKVLIVLTELLGGYYVIKLLQHLNLNTHRIWTLFLNPLWIIECTGNAHFEGVMISFLFIALYFIIKKEIIRGSGLFALAVQIKLIPLMLLPLFLRFLGWGKAILFYALTLVLVVAFGIIMIHSENISNFIESLSLYFKVFEFNSLVYFNYLEYGYNYYGWYPIRTFGAKLSRLSTFIILAIAFYGDITNWKSLFNRMSFALLIYLLLSSTVHPWYILTLLSVSLFTNYSYPVIWSYLIFFTYFFYAIGTGDGHEVRYLVHIEYAILIAIVIYEIIRKKPLLKFLELKDQSSFLGTGS